MLFVLLDEVKVLISQKKSFDMSKEKATEGQIRIRKYIFTLGPLGLKPCKDNPRNKYHS